MNILELLQQLLPYCNTVCLLLVFLNIRSKSTHVTTTLETPYKLLEFLREASTNIYSVVKPVSNFRQQFLVRLEYGLFLHSVFKNHFLSNYLDIAAVNSTQIYPLYKIGVDATSQIKTAIISIFSLQALIYYHLLLGKTFKYAGTETILQIPDTEEEILWTLKQLHDFCKDNDINSNIYADINPTEFVHSIGCSLNVLPPNESKMVRNSSIDKVCGIYD